MKKEIAVLGVLFSSSAMAQYQVELDAGVVHVETQANRSGFARYNDAYETTDLTATYYFVPVVTENVALSDAAFLARSSSLKVSLQESNFNDFDESSKLVDLQWVAFSGAALGLIYEEREGGNDNYIEEWSGPGVRIGQYIGDSSMISLRYQNHKYEYRDENMFDDESRSNREIYALSYKNVIIENNLATADIEIELEKSNEYVQLRSKLGWYAGKNIKYGVTAGIIDFDRYRPGRRSFSVWGEWFILQNLAFSADYQVLKVQTNSGGSDFRFEEDSVRLGIAYRF